MVWRPALIGVLALVAFTVPAEALLLQFTHTYFGGGQMNRPVAVTETAEQALYFTQALVYDLLLYGTLGCLLMTWALPRRRLNPPQRAYIVFASMLLVVGGAVALRWEVHRYLRHMFDLEALAPLLGDRLFNILGGLSYDRFTVVSVTLFAAFAILASIGIIRFLGTVEPRRIPRSRRLTAAAALAWAALVANHFAMASVESVRFGLSGKMSYSAVNGVLSLISDFDRDGYGPLTYPGDPDPFDPAVHAYALDRPGNGIDEDRLAGDLDPPRGEMLHTAFDGFGRTNGMNVVVAVVETFRVDVVQMQLDGKPVMPFLSSLANSSGYTAHAYSNYGSTSESILSILTGTLRLERGGYSLLDHLRRQGYRTLGVSAQNEGWGGTDQALGLDRLSEFYDARDKRDWGTSGIRLMERLNPVYLSFDSREVNARALTMIDRAAGRPFVIYLNYQDLHHPYFEEWMDPVFIDEGRIDIGFFRPENVAAILRQYANAAHHLDASIASLFEGLDDRGILDNTVVVIVGDHSESFYENGLLGHYFAVDEHQRRTPLFVVNGAGSYDAPVGQDEIVEIVLKSIDGNHDHGPLSFRVDPDKRIFVFTGNLERPRRIAWIGPDDLVTYDFKLGRVQFGEDGAWKRPSELDTDPDAARIFDALVHRWETEVWLANGSDDR